MSRREKLTFEEAIQAWEEGESLPSHSQAIPIPVEDLDEELIECSECKAPIKTEVFFEGDDFICQPCFESSIEAAEAEAAARVERCAIKSRPLPPYDPALEFAPTPEEYAMGDRVAYSPGSYLTHCRHNLTNYDELIDDLDKERFLDSIVYVAVHNRILALVVEAVREDRVCAEHA
jgi:hypothetical protein